MVRLFYDFLPQGHLQGLVYHLSRRRGRCRPPESRWRGGETPRSHLRNRTLALSPFLSLPPLQEFPTPHRVIKQQPSTMAPTPRCRLPGTLPIPVGSNQLLHSKPIALIGVTSTKQQSNTLSADRQSGPIASDPSTLSFVLSRFSMQHRSQIRRCVGLAVDRHSRLPPEAPNPASVLKAPNLPPCLKFPWFRQPARPVKC